LPLPVGRVPLGDYVFFGAVPAVKCSHPAHGPCSKYSVVQIGLFEILHTSLAAWEHAQLRHTPHRVRRFCEMS
jgi:hypothetical protein